MNNFKTDLFEEILKGTTKTGQRGSEQVLYTPLIYKIEPPPSNLI